MIERTGNNQDKPQQPNNGVGQTQAGQGPNVNMHPAGDAAYRPDSQQGQHRPGFRRLNDKLKRSATSERSEARVAEALKQMNRAKESAIESQVMKIEPLFFRFDRQTQNTLMSAIIAAFTYKVGNVTTIAVRPLLLETQDSPLPKRQRQYGQMREEFQMRAQDVYDRDYWQKVVAFIKDQLKLPEANVVDAGVLLIPDAYKMKDQVVGFDFENEASVKELVVQTSNRLEDALAQVSNEPPLNLTDLMSDNDRLRVKIETDLDMVEVDSVGNPIRSDMRIVMKVAGGNNQPNNLYGDSLVTETELNSVCAYVDFEYQRPPQHVNPQHMGPNYVPPKPFIPVIVATAVRNASWIQANTIELYLLGLSNLYRCMNGMAWAQTRNPKFTGQDPKGKSVNMRDIAALAYLTSNPPSKPNLLSSDASDQDFVDFMYLTVEQNPAFAFDFDPVGENVAIESTFALSASNSEHRQKAKDAIIRACDNLTNGNFSRFFNASSDIVVATGTEIHLGRYPDAHGDIRDPRDLDTVAALNLSKGNINEFVAWYKTRLAPEQSGDTFEGVMRKRESIERNYLSQGMTITRRAPRYLFTQQFLDALDEAMAAAGARVEMNEVLGMSGEQFLGNTMISQYTVNTAPRTAGMGGPGGHGGGYSYGHPGMGGWESPHGGGGGRY
jgi:hypothetical protein